MTRIGVIGTGYWGKNLLRNFSALGALTAFCDSKGDVRREFSARYPSAIAFADSAEMIASPSVDAVVIATPAASHASLAIAALTAGKHVFVEKPLCLDLAEGQRLKSFAEKYGLTLMVGHLLLYHPAFRALSAVVRGGQLGQLRYVYSNRLSLGKIRREENALWSFAPHDISMILNLVGSLPTSVLTSGASYLRDTVADTTLSHLKFTDGVQAHVFVSWLHPYKEHRLVVIGKDGMAVFDDSQDGERKLLRYSHNVSWMGDLPTINKADAVPISYDPAEPLALECQHFLDCISQGRRPLSDAVEALDVLAVLNACQTSLMTGQSMPLATISK